jgi:uncharacterized lipoprotein NlpE involved in copper resistance
MKIRHLLIATLSIAFFLSCQSNQNKSKLQDTTTTFIDEHTSQNSVDWAGTYEATLPCADCPRIKSTLSLRDDNTFKCEWEYLERNVKVTDSGSFTWLDGNSIKLNGKESDNKFQVGENRIIQVDTNGNPITGPLKEHYVYSKKEN